MQITTQVRPSIWPIALIRSSPWSRRRSAASDRGSRKDAHRVVAPEPAFSQRPGALGRVHRSSFIDFGLSAIRYKRTFHARPVSLHRDFRPVGRNGNERKQELTRMHAKSSG